MGRPANRCKRCGGPQRGRSGRVSDIVAYCTKCREGVCTRHLVMRDGEYLCTKCDREG
jgi:hypothetical protein